MKTKQRDGFGVADFKIICEPKEVRMEIHNKQVVAKTNQDVYNKIFDYAVKAMGGRIDGYK